MEKALLVALVPPELKALQCDLTWQPISHTHSQDIKTGPSDASEKGGGEFILDVWQCSNVQGLGETVQRNQ